MNPPTNPSVTAQAVAKTVLLLSEQYALRCDGIAASPLLAWLAGSVLEAHSDATDPSSLGMPSLSGIPALPYSPTAQLV